MSFSAGGGSELCPGKTVPAARKMKRALVALFVFLAECTEHWRCLMPCMVYQRFQVAGLELLTCQSLLNGRQLQDHT